METTFSNGTYHSIIRAKERTGLSERKTTRMIGQAWEKGKRAREFSSMEKSYLEQKEFGGHTAVAYNNYCYIFCEEGFCITLFPLPGWFGKKKRFDGKERIRDLHKYCKNYSYLTSYTSNDELEIGYA